MLFNSPEYILLFLPLVVLLYFWLNHMRLVMGAKICLIAASIFFYGYWNPSYLPLIITSIFVNFAIGFAIQRDFENRAGQFAVGSARSHAKLYLWLGVIFNLGFLGYFKYADFFILNANYLFSTDIEYLNLLLPLAISFFTFQQIAYVVDCYQGKVRSTKFLDYSLFVTFFPQLISGPIVHHAEMMPQFKRLRAKIVNWENISMGVFIFVVGLFKKVAVADTFSVWARKGFDSDMTLSLLDSWQTMLAYIFQLYFDFSGYCDMAIGAALLLNIRLPVNFNSPYQATNIADLWNRWHMTLSRWLRDYLYIPLGGNRRGTFRTYANLLITMILGGLWHGAAWTFVIFGAINGIALAVHRLWSNLGITINKHIACLMTFLLFSFSVVFFRAESVERALDILKGLFGGYGVIPAEGLISKLGLIVSGDAAFNGPLGQLAIVTPQSIFFTLVFGFVIFACPNILKISGYIPYDGKFSIQRSKYLAFYTGILAFLSMLSYLGGGEPSEFLYYNF